MHTGMPRPMPHWKELWQESRQEWALEGDASYKSGGQGQSSGHRGSARQSLAWDSACSVTVLREPPLPPPWLSEPQAALSSAPHRAQVILPFPRPASLI